MAARAFWLWVRRMNTRPRKGNQTLVDAWWDAVLLGETDEPHPVFGQSVSARIHGERLEIAGELDRKSDRAELVEQARARIGHGVREVDASHLRVAHKRERPGILEQTLAAAFPNRETAELARILVIERGRIRPTREAIVDPGNEGELGRLLPEEFVEDARQRIGKGDALLVLRIDETEAFRVRELLEEDTRSTWTIATPPTLIAAGRSLG
ncbi:MAG TPA: hypothetical protein VGE99_07635 [Candidatus Dormibacteraeota bacterium]